MDAGGLPVAQRTLPTEQFVTGSADDCVAARDYQDHRGLSRTLEAAGIAQTASRTTAGGSAVVIMRVAACLRAKLPAVRSRHTAAA
ncbi:MAG: hypothetical protein L0H93_21590 [Nocardioides sp.]|nr:hypothetical protein [Nocardioides sp.]